MLSETINWERFTKVLPEGNRGRGGEFSSYRIIKVDSNETLAEIKFQNEPVKLAGVNGVFNEDLLTIVLHRLECFEAGEFKHHANQVAITHIARAIEALHKRTKDRITREVEGTYEK
jgi:hypothetical protein